jgi:hypothetical protein
MSIKVGSLTVRCSCGNKKRIPLVVSRLTKRGLDLIGPSGIVKYVEFQKCGCTYYFDKKTGIEFTRLR